MAAENGTAVIKGTKRRWRAAVGGRATAGSDGASLETGAGVSHRQRRPSENTTWRSRRRQRQRQKYGIGKTASRKTPWRNGVSDGRHGDCGKHRRTQASLANRGRRHQTKASWRVSYRVSERCGDRCAGVAPSGRISKRRQSALCNAAWRRSFAIARQRIERALRHQASWQRRHRLRHSRSRRLQKRHRSGETLRRFSNGV